MTDADTCGVDGCSQRPIGTLNDDPRCETCMLYDIEEGLY